MIKNFSLLILVLIVFHSTTSRAIDLNNAPLSENVFDLRNGAGPRDWIRKAYLDCLERKASEREINAWINSKLSGRDAHEGICESEEGRTVLIANLYEDCLDRKAAEPEIRGWVKSGQNRDALENSICESQEGRTTAIRSSYSECLGRNPIAAELSHWLKMNQSTQEIWNGVCRSDEARLRRQAARADAPQHFVPHARAAGVSRPRH